MADSIRVGMTVEAAWHRVPGGTGRVAIALADALHRRDDTEVVGVAAAHRGSPGADWEVTVPVRHHRLPRPVLYESWSRWSRPRLRSNDLDLVHSTTIIPPPDPGVPLVVSVHDLAFRRSPERFPTRARKLYERSWRRVLERADAVISPSTATSADLRAGGLDADRLHVIPLGHDPLPVGEGQVAAVRSELAIAGRYVLAAGTLEPRKNIPTLIEAFEQVHDDAVLVVVGPSGWGDAPADAQAKVSSAMRERVLFAGSVSNETLAALYTDASAFCYPSLLEGFGLPVLEAMSYGAPVVTSRGTATEEVAGDAALTIDPTDPSAIAGALNDLLGDSSASTELARRGRERARRFSWDECAGAVRALYEGL